MMKTLRRSECFCISWNQPKDIHWGKLPLSVRATLCLSILVILFCFTLLCPLLVVFQSLTSIGSLPSSPCFFSFFSSPLSLSFVSFSPLTLARLCQMSFYLSQQSFCVRGPFREYIGKDKTKGRPTSISLLHVFSLSLSHATIHCVQGFDSWGENKSRKWMYKHCPAISLCLFICIPPF